MRFASALPAILLVIAGCDDEVVTAKITDVLTYGSIAAEVECRVTNKNYCVPYTVGATTPCWDSNIWFKSQRLVDGSFYTTCKVTSVSTSYFPTYIEVIFPFPNLTGRGGVAEVRNPYSGSRWGTSYAGDAVCEAVDGNLNVRSEAGTIKDGDAVHYWVNPTFFSLPLTDSDCHGRNLEAFGVTP